MALHKTSELTDAALDWAVAKCLGQDEEYVLAPEQFKLLRETSADSPFFYSTDWAQGGPIIEREHIALDYYHTPIHPDVQPRWEALHGSGVFEYGPTPLIAAMRSYVASKLGDEVEVPDELV